MFWEAWEFFRDPVLAGTFAGATLGMIGVYIVLRKMIFFSAALSQISGLGIALSFFAAIHLGAHGIFASPSVVSAVATIGAALLLTIFAQRNATKPGQSSNEILLGLFFLLGASGILVVGTQIVEEVRDINSLLFGTAVAVLPEDFSLIVRMSLILLLVHFWLWRGFTSITFSHDDAKVRNLPTTMLSFILLTGIAIAISITTRVLGALPAFAFSVLPSIAALKMAPNIPIALILAAIFGAIMGFGGYLLAFLYDTPVGATQALLGVFIVFSVSVLQAIVNLLTSSKLFTPNPK